MTHYKTNTRQDTDYWRANAANLNLSDNLKKLYSAWMTGKSIAAGVSQQVIGRGYPLFSWYSIMAGMGVFPDTHSLRAPTSAQARFSMAEIDNLLDRSAAQLSGSPPRVGCDRAPPDRPLLTDLFLVGALPGAHMNPTLPEIPVVPALDDEAVRRDVIGSARPAILRGWVKAWPSVAAGRRSPAALVEYLRGFDNGAPVDAIMTPPEVEGRVFYDAAMNGFNFIRNRLPVSTIAEQVLRYSGFPRPPAVAVQSALIRDCLPGFAAQNPLSVLEGVEPRIWFGNAITTPAHLDEWNNIGCVVSGRRRFTLFPPEQIANLYIGPLDFAPTGAPMSLVRLHAPDFERFPRFRTALAAAMSAELEPGDAIYIPPLWWHHVESLEPFNLLVNYWWHAAPARAPRHRTRLR